MSAVAQTPVAPAELDPFLPHHLDDPYPLYTRLRELGPAVLLESRGVWLVTGYAPVAEVLRDYRTYLSGLGTSYVRVADSGYRFPFIDNDPPEHSRVRRAVQGSFSRRAVEDLRPLVDVHVDKLLAAAAGGTVDVMDAVARPLPDLVVRDLTGVVPPSTEAMAAWADAVFHVLGPEPAPEHYELVGQATAWLAGDGVAALPKHCLGRQIIDDGGPGGGLAEGEERLLALASIWAAGVDTTTALIGNLLHAFATHPDQWQAVVDEPGLAASAVEEALRWESPIRVFLRRTSRTADLGGVTIPADADICALFPAANRDPAHYRDPDRFDVRRNPTDHLALGASIHLCLGAPVARLEVVELVRALIERVDHVELAGEPVRNPSRVIRGFTSLPMRLVMR